MADIYQSITDKIVVQIERGAGTWRMPWHTKAGAKKTGFASLPRNVAGRAYRGVNVPVLWATAQAFGYESPIWATYKQWSERGCQVRKGEKSAMVVFWKSVETENDDGETEKHLIAKAYFVFNAAQVDGFDGKAPAPKETASIEDLSEEQRIASADAFFAATGSVVRHGGNRAFFTPGGDFIQMPEFAQFTDPMSYYSTLAHEHVHWTGTKARCDRQFSARFGDQAYAFEELVAELGAAFLCAVLGLSNEPRADHASYIQSWLRTLKGDKKAIFTAASKAQAAADYLQSLQVSETKLAA